MTMQPAATERVLRRLEWKVVRRLDGLLQGAYRTPYRGSGLDFVALRSYDETDDARYIDWNATARLTEPQVRQFTEDREITLWLVLDRSASMDVGASGRGKADVLTDLALSLARLFGRGGNRVGAVLYDGSADRPVRIVPAGTGRRHTLRIGHELERVGAPRGGSSPTTDLAAMLEAVATAARRRSLVVVVSDLIGTGDWDRPLRRLAQRHEVVALRVVDRSDDELPDAGLIVVEDAETGEQLVVDSGDPLFRARYRDGVAERDAELLARMRHAGVPLHRVDTGRDVVETLVEVVSRTQWVRQ